MKDKTQKVHIQAWVDVRQLADLIHWLRSEGYTDSRMATAISQLIELLHRSIQKQFTLTQFKSDMEALSYLAQHGYILRARNRLSTISVELDHVPEDVNKIATDLFRIVGEEVK